MYLLLNRVLISSLPGTVKTRIKGWVISSSKVRCFFVFPFGSGGRFLVCFSPLFQRRDFFGLHKIFNTRLLFNYSLGEDKTQLSYMNLAIDTSRSE